MCFLSLHRGLSERILNEFGSFLVLFCVCTLGLYVSLMLLWAVVKWAHRPYRKTVRPDPAFCSSPVTSKRGCSTISVWFLFCVCVYFRLVCDCFVFLCVGPPQSRQAYHLSRTMDRSGFTFYSLIEASQRGSSFVLVRFLFCCVPGDSALVWRWIVFLD